jgi:hypothetical protein
MDTKLVNYRESTMYMSEDGRKIEGWKKIGQIPIHVDEGTDENDFESSQEELLFYGFVIAPVYGLGEGPQGPQLVQAGIKEFRFPIVGATTLEEAFEKYPESRQTLLDEMNKHREEAQAELDSQIVTAGEGVLNQIDKASGIVTP